MSKSQAEHNEEVCKYLHKANKYPDWVISSAFYSAIHYIDCCLFPDAYTMPNGHTKNCHSIDDYYNKSNQRIKMHQIRMHLVEDNFDKIANSFKWLLEQSFQLRYRNYLASPDEAEIAIKYLKEIKDFFTENQK